MAIPPRSRGKALAQARSSYAARRLLLPVQKFVHTEATSGILLLAAAVGALVWANSAWSGSYEVLWKMPAAVQVGGWGITHSLREWINDALMVLFFFVVGLEVKREFVHGELSDWRRGSLPVVCAVGGMLAPALLYAAFNHGGAGARGWGIPMATDIAFGLGVLALVGDRVPGRIRIFLLALATVDDIGAILVIALFYSEKVSVAALAGALVLLAGMLGMRRIGVQSLLTYAPFALLFWFVIMHSGIHATIAGVVLGLITPTSPYATKTIFLDSVEGLLSEIKAALASGEQSRAEAVLGVTEELTVATEAPADRLVRILHPWTSYVVLPVFALANAGIPLTANVAHEALRSPVSQGVIAGLVLGKVAGIAGFAYLAFRLRLAAFMAGVGWLHLAGIGLLGGMGFTVSLFMTDLAFAESGITEEAKLGVLIASILSGVAGYAVLRAATARSAVVE